MRVSALIHPDPVGAPHELRHHPRRHKHDQKTRQAEPAEKIRHEQKPPEPEVKTRRRSRGGGEGEEKSSKRKSRSLPRVPRGEDDPPAASRHVKAGPPPPTLRSVLSKSMHLLEVLRPGVEIYEL